MLAREHLFRRSSSANLPVMHKHDLVGDSGCLIEVVEDNAECCAAIGEIANKVECFNLITQIEVVGGLIEQQDTGVLCQGCREPDTLQFAAG